MPCEPQWVWVWHAFVVVHLGNRWSKIAQHLPGRTDNEIKNYWRTRIQKQARQLNIESGSKRFIDAVKCFWMPRLLQKMEQSNSPSPQSSMTTMMNLGNSGEASMSSMSSSFNINPSMSSSSSPPQREFIMDDANHFNTMSNPINPSPDSFQFSQLLEISEHPKSPSNVFENNVCSYPIQDNCYVDTNNYGMEGINMDPLSAMDTYDFPQFDFQTAGNGWMLDSMGDSTLWNMEAMWQCWQEKACISSSFHRGMLYYRKKKKFEDSYAILILSVSIQSQR